MEASYERIGSIWMILTTARTQRAGSSCSSGSRFQASTVLKESSRRCEMPCRLRCRYLFAAYLGTVGAFGTWPETCSSCAGIAGR